MFTPYSKAPTQTLFFKHTVGKEPVYHVTASDAIVICRISGYNRYIYPAVMDPAAKILARAINSCKLVLNRRKGGSFCINEFGVVIVPGMNVDPLAIGTWRGDLNFQDPDTDEIFSLSGTGLRIGQVWKYPYLGMKYQLSRRGEIYRWWETPSGSYREDPAMQDAALVANLRRIRNTGAMTFIVNDHGVAIAKDEYDVPRYAGKIDYIRWF